MYPGKHNQSDFAFVQQLVEAIAAKGHECFVIAPYNINHYRRIVRMHECNQIGAGSVSVFRPYYFSFSGIKILQKFVSWSHWRAIGKAIRMLPYKPDVLYGHFWQSGYYGFEYAKSNNIPLFVASGEADVKDDFDFPSDVKEFSNYVKGVVCVSSKNRDESVALGLTTEDKCIVFPNSVNAQLFKQRSRIECRKQLGLPQDAFIVVFVGYFRDRKGPLRVAEAIKRAGGVNSIFIGRGEQDPQCDGILFKGTLPHDKIPQYMSAADAFVLPTLAEGCCNSIVEALSCGLPVISSNLSFNWDVLTDENSIMIDPNSVDEICAALIKLRDDKSYRNKLSEGALRRAQSLTIDKRADGIIEFIAQRIKC